MTANVRFIDIDLPPSSHASLRETTDEYMNWLALVDYRLWLDYKPVFEANVARAAAAIGEDDALAVFLNAAPLFRLFLSETAYAARQATEAGRG